MTTRFTKLSDTFSTELSIHYPKLSKYLKIDRTIKSSWSRYYLRVPNPLYSSDDTDLFVVIYNDYIWIVFSHSHKKIWVDSQRSREQASLDALTFVNEIINAEVSSISWWQEDEKDFKKADTFMTASDDLEPNIDFQYDYINVHTWGREVEKIVRPTN